MKKRNLLLVMLAVLLAFGLVIGCDLDPVESDPFASYYQDYQTTYKISTVSYTETIKITKDLITFYDNAVADTANPDFIKFEVTKWENASVPGNVNTDYPDAVKEFTKGVKIFGVITDAKPKDASWSADATVKVLYGGATCPGITEQDITDETELYFYLYFTDEDDPEDLHFVRSSIYKAGITGQQNPIKSREYKAF